MIKDTIRSFWWRSNNFGDTLTPIVMEYLGYDTQYVDRDETDKLIAIGSILHTVKKGDIVWGAGLNKEDIIDAPEANFLAVRGPYTRSKIRGAEVPEVYGDPALLLSLIYKPEIEKLHKVGVIPHYADKPFVKIDKDMHYIDIQSPWQMVINDILSCELIISSSLHGVIVAEAYGIPAVWALFGDRVVGAEFKFHDYFLGTDRGVYDPFMVLPPIENLAEIQRRLLVAIGHVS